MVDYLYDSLHGSHVLIRSQTYIKEVSDSVRGLLILFVDDC